MRSASVVGDMAGVDGVAPVVESFQTCGTFTMPESLHRDILDETLG